MPKTTKIPTNCQLDKMFLGLTAFTANVRCPDLWFMSSPKFNVTQLVTGGLQTLYGKINTNRSVVKDENGFGSEVILLDSNGDFVPPTENQLLGRRYRFLEHLACGFTAHVIGAQDTFHNNNVVIIKILRSECFIVGAQEVQVLQEIGAADPLCTVPIIRMLNRFIHGEHYCVVFEPLDKLPLDHHFANNLWVGMESLDRIRKVASQLFVALEFLHRRSIIHGDIKFDNILCREDRSNGVEICIIDLGNFIRCTPEELMFYTDDFDCQIMQYRAPEVSFGVSVGLEIDMWSAGCLLAELYLGNSLFSADTKEGVLKQISAILGPFPPAFSSGKFGSDLGQFVGNSCSTQETYYKLQNHLGCSNVDFLSLLNGLMTYEPEKRWTALEAMSCNFVARYFPTLSRKANTDLDGSTSGTGKHNQSIHQTSTSSLPNLTELTTTTPGLKRSCSVISRFNGKPKSGLQFVRKNSQLKRPFAKKQCHKRKANCKK